MNTKAALGEFLKINDLCTVIVDIIIIIVTTGWKVTRGVIAVTTTTPTNIKRERRR